MTSTSTSEEPTKICPSCLTGAIMLGTPTGKMLSLDMNEKRLEYYLAGEQYEGKSNGKIIVLACDIFGLGVPNPRLIADGLSTALHMPVYVPDLLEGDHPSPAGLTMIETPINHLSFFTRAKLTAQTMGGFLFKIGPAFLYRHRPGVMVPLADNFCKTLRTQKGALKIGMVGYCMGGTIVTKLAAETYTSVDALVCCHPGQLSVGDFKIINKPFAMICSQEDFAFDSIKKDALAVLEEKKAKGLAVAIYEHPGTTHGFCARPRTDIPLIKIAFEKSLEQTADWFKEHLVSV